MVELGDNICPVCGGELRYYDIALEEDITEPSST